MRSNARTRMHPHTRSNARTCTQTHTHIYTHAPRTRPHRLCPFRFVPSRLQLALRFQMYPFSLGMFRAMHAHGARTVQVMQFTERVMEAQRNAIVELKTMRLHRSL
jgi:hypothetical protein